MARPALVLARLALATGLGLAVAHEAEAARPGGGSSFGGGGGGSRSSGGGGYSGGGGSSYRSSSSSWSTGSGSGGGGDIGPAGFLGLFVAFGLAAGIRIVVEVAKSSDAWATVVARHRGQAPISHEEAFRVPRRRPKRRTEPVSLDALREHDPNFSQILLEDFLYELYTRAQEARGSEESLALLAPYLDPFVRDALSTRGLRKVLAVSGVIVGAMQITKLELRDGMATLEVEYETNYTETYPSESGQGQLGFYAKERWSLQRRLSARSRRPDETRSFGCPSCGAPVEHDQALACRHCGTTHGTGDFEWCCTRIGLMREETRGPALGGYAPEVGTHDRTVRAKDLDERMAELEGHDPAFDRARFLARVDMIYHRLNDAWSSLCWEDARPFLSDRLWLSMRYWIHAYQQQDLQNRMERAKVDHTELAKVVLDPFFHAITVRVWASAIDTTIHRPTGMVVGGNPDEPRKYSEYWTFIRSAQRRGASSSDDAQCPSCAAPLSINMAGSCEHCGVKLTAGQFDWVLSKIEQDEAYRG